MQAGAAYTIFGYTITTGELLIAAAMGLLAAGALLFLRRRQTVALRRSLVTDELMLHLSRIADLLERQAMRPIQVVMPETTQRTEDGSQQRFQEPTGSIAYSMFGR